MTALEDVTETMARYLELKVTPASAPDAWARLWQRVADAYRAGRLSDSEFDALLSQLAQM